MQRLWPFAGIALAAFGAALLSLLASACSFGSNSIPPEAPKVSGFAIAASTRPTWRWDRPYTADSFLCKVEDAESSWTRLGGDVLEYRSSVELSAGKTYVFAVKALNSLGYASAVSSFSTSIVSLSPPKINAKPYTPLHRPLWTWTAADNAVSYLCRIEGVESSWTSCDAASKYHESASDLSAGSSYVFAVKSVSVDGAESAEASTTTLIVLLEAPSLSVAIPIDSPLRPVWSWTVPRYCKYIEYILRVDGVDDASGWTTVGQGIQSYSPAKDLEPGHVYALAARNFTDGVESAEANCEVRL
jgi:hypothetical protein